MYFGIVSFADQKRIFKIMLYYFFLSAIEGGCLMHIVLALNHPHSLCIFIHIYCTYVCVCARASK